VVLQVSVEELAEIFKGALSWSELEQVCARRRWDGTDPGAFLTGAGAFFFVTPKSGGVGVTDFHLSPFFFPFDFFPVLFDQQRMVKKWDVSKKHRDSWGFTRPELGFD
jgi:hypothetical protein